MSSTVPAVLPAVGWRFPAVEDRRLDNGLRILAYHCPGQYVVTASLLFDVPLNAETREREGVAGLTGRCLTQGAAGRTAEEFADALALCGADLDGSAFPDGFAVRLSVPVTHLRSGLDLMADAVTEPTFAATDFEHEKRLRLQEIDQTHAYPQHVAAEQLNEMLFGTARAARPVGGSAETVEAITRADLVSFADTHLQPGNATLVIAGDFLDVDLYDVTAASLGGWEHIGGRVVEVEQARVHDGAQLALIDWPDAPQATVRVAGEGVTRGDPRWPALFVANYAVGGNFSSRVNTVLREQKGVTYGATSTLDTGRRAGIVSISTAVRSDATAQSLADIVDIVAGARGSITDDEVATAVRAATESAALGFERSDAVVGRVEMLLSQRLPLGHVDANLERIRQVTTERANTAYTEVVRPGDLTVVVVGDAASLRQSLADWGHAELQEIAPPAR